MLNRYVLYVLISALAGAAGLILTEILLRAYAISVLSITIQANLVGGLFLLLSSVAQGSRRWRGWPVTDWLRLLVASAATFAAGFLLLYGAVDLIGSSKTSLLGRLEVIFIVALAVIFLGERWTRKHWLAGGLALFGAALVNFDAEAFDLQFGLGELMSLGSVVTFSVGIILLKSLVDRQDGQLVTGFGLLLGAALLMPVAIYQGVAINTIPQAGWLAALLLLVRGLFLGISWVTYNVAMKHIGASRCSVLFLSLVVFTVLLQVSADAIAPGLGLRVPPNLSMSILGGIIICGAVVLLQREA
jgi:drug/metabolite transporter (DMT)-like permease